MDVEIDKVKEALRAEINKNKPIKLRAESNTYIAICHKYRDEISQLRHQKGYTYKEIENVLKGLGVVVPWGSIRAYFYKYGLPEHE